MKRKYDFLRFLRRLPQVLSYLVVFERVLELPRLLGGMISVIKNFIEEFPEYIEVLLEYLQDLIG